MISNMSSNMVEDVPKNKRATAQYIAVSIHTLLLFFAAFIIAYPVIIISGLTNPNEVIKVDQEGLSWIGSIYLVCVPIGCLVSGTIVEYLGRRKALQIANVAFIVSWILFYFSDAAFYIYLALAITGLSSGSLEVPILTYVSESVEPHLRGTLSSTSSVMSYLGGTVMIVFGMFMSWRNIALMSAFFHIPSIISLFFVPESPVWLIRKDRYEEAKASLAWLRGWTTIPAVEDEYKQLYSEVKTEDQSKISNRRMAAKFLKNDTVWPFSILLFVMFLSHFTGMSALFTYSVPIVMTLQCPINSLHAAGIIVFTAIVGSVSNFALIHKFGKRILTMVSLVGMGVCYAGVAVYSQVFELRELYLPINNSTAEPEVVVPREYTWIPLLLLILFTFFSHVGVRSVQWILMTELFNHDVRSVASGVCCAITFLLNFVVNKTFFLVLDAFTFQGMFWLYVAVNLVSCVVIFFVLPETEGKTLAAISEHFSGGRKLGNRVFKKPKTKGVVNESYVGEEKDQHSV